MLERFYTDICGNVGLGQFLALAGPLSPSLGRLERRRVPAVVIPVTRTFPLQTALHVLRNRFARPEPVSRFRANIQWQNAVGRAAARSGFGNATHLFTMLGEFPTLLTAAKEHGLQVVTEVYTLLSLERIVAKERKLFPGWDSADQDFDSVRRELFSEDVMLRRSDLFICPSSPVRDDLVLNWGVPPLRTALVPYGVDPRWLAREPLPVEGRILFVGNAGLRKGVHYLAMAAKNSCPAVPASICRARRLRLLCCRPAADLPTP